MRVRRAFDMVRGLDSAGWEKRLDDYEAARVRHSGSWLQTGIIKAFADGVVESRTAAMLEPYEGSSESGEPLWEPGELVQAARPGRGPGWPGRVDALCHPGTPDAVHTDSAA